jgi:hypothetical protein
VTTKLAGSNQEGTIPRIYGIFGRVSKRRGSQPLTNSFSNYCDEDLMALVDLLESIENLARALDVVDPGYALYYRELKKKVEDARASGSRQALMYLLLTDVADDFITQMGVLIPDGQFHFPPDLPEEEAWPLLDKRMDDYFFNFLFWDTEKTKAREIYSREMKRHNFDCPPRTYFHKNTEWFEKWSDWGKLVTGPELAGAYRTKDYLRPH